MNYIECFNRSRAANCLQPVFFRSWCASMLPGLECCSRCTFAPFLVSRCCQVWSVAAGAPFAPFLVSRCCQVWSVAADAPFALFLVPRCCQVWGVTRAPLRRSWCASMLPGVECYPCTFCAVPGASMLPGVDVLQPVPLCAVPGASMLPGVE